MPEVFFFKKLFKKKKVIEDLEERLYDLFSYQFGKNWYYTTS